MANLYLYIKLTFEIWPLGLLKEMDWIGNPNPKKLDLATP